MILIEVQQSGDATFAELTELDELINRDPKLRDIILEEMEETNAPIDKPFNRELKKTEEPAHQTLLDRSLSFIKNLNLFYKSTSVLPA